MRSAILNILMLLLIPLTLIPILLGAADELESRRQEHFFRMRLEHMRSMARDRKRRALRELQYKEAQSVPRDNGPVDRRIASTSKSCP